MNQPATTSRALRRFGLGLFVILGLIAGLLFWRERAAWPCPAGAGGVVLALSLFFPRGLLPIYRFMMWLAPILAWVNTKIILTLVFFLIFTPVGLITRLFRIDLLSRKLEPESKSYWLKRENPPFDPDSYEKQF